MSNDAKEDGDLPPSYSEATNSPCISGNLGDPDPTQHAPRLVEHLSTLPGRVRELQEANDMRQSASDLELIDLLVLHVTQLIPSISNTLSRNRIAELICVPEAAVPEEWTLSEKNGEHLVRVKPREPGLVGGQSNEKGVAPRGDQQSAEVSSRGEEAVNNPLCEVTWWWKDEAMALRLAKLLQPRDGTKLDRQVARQETGKSLVHRLLALRRSTTSASPRPDSANNVSRENQVMTARPYLVAFRFENEFGLLESMSGWALKVVVTI